jgi:hypothetical protein
MQRVYSLKSTLKITSSQGYSYIKIEQTDKRKWLNLIIDKIENHIQK